MYKPSEIESHNLLSAFLRTSPETLHTFVNGFQYIVDWKSDSMTMPNDKPNGFYIIQKFYIPKKNKALGFREVYKLQEQFTVDILKTLKFILDDIYKPEKCVHGFVTGRNTLSNAKLHLGKKHLLKLDIKHFFDSIKKEAIINAFVSLGFPLNTSEQLTKICTIKDHLAQGFPSSPVLANIVCVQMDKKLNKLCKQQKATYTRYADDISISSDIYFNKKDMIKAILLEHGFELNELKSQRFKYGQNQYVTGLSVSDSLYPRIPKHIKRKIRQNLHYLSLYGYHSHICHINSWSEETDYSVTSEPSSKLRNYIKGWIDYMNPIEPLLAKKFYKKFNLIDKEHTKYQEQELIKLIGENGRIVITGKFKEPIIKKHK